VKKRKETELSPPLATSFLLKGYKILRTYNYIVRQSITKYTNIIKKYLILFSSGESSYQKLNE